MTGEKLHNDFGIGLGKSVWRSNFSAGIKRGFGSSFDRSSMTYDKSFASSLSGFRNNIDRSMPQTHKMDFRAMAFHGKSRPRRSRLSGLDTEIKFEGPSFENVFDNIGQDLFSPALFEAKSLAKDN